MFRVGRFGAVAFADQQQQFVAGVDRRVDAFGQHGGAARDGGDDEFAGGDAEVGDDGRVDHLQRAACDLFSVDMSWFR
jgi:hypothetical protein